MSLFTDNNLALSQKRGTNIDDYTPLIKAIKNRNVDEVQTLLINGADPNETDSVYGWRPIKWASFVYEYAPDRNDNDDNPDNMYRIMGLLITHNATNDPNEILIDDGVNDFESFINANPDAINRIFASSSSGTTNVYGTSGGKRVRKSKKSKKTKKSRKSRKGTSKKYKNTKK